MGKRDLIIYTAVDRNIETQFDICTRHTTIQHTNSILLLTIYLFY